MHYILKYCFWRYPSFKKSLQRSTLSETHHNETVTWSRLTFDIYAHTHIYAHVYSRTSQWMSSCTLRPEKENRWTVTYQRLQNTVKINGVTWRHQWWHTHTQKKTVVETDQTKHNCHRRNFRCNHGTENGKRIGRRCSQRTHAAETWNRVFTRQTNQLQVTMQIHLPTFSRQRTSKWRWRKFIFW